jgi:hypothetical protein
MSVRLVETLRKRRTPLQVAHDKKASRLRSGKAFVFRKLPGFFPVNSGGRIGDFPMSRERRFRIAFSGALIPEIDIIAGSDSPRNSEKPK